MRISVIGAYGYTGQLICNELDKAGLVYAIAGRDAVKLEALHAQLTGAQFAFTGDITQPDFAEEIIHHTDLILNCAGPFTEESTDFLNRVAASGKAYLDISGELGFVRDSQLKLHHLALASKALILNACAFESFLVDLAVQAVTGKEKITEINTYYWFNKHLVSPGTRITMKLSKFRESLKITDGQWAPCNLKNDRFSVMPEGFETPLIAVSYPLPEIAFFKWTLNPIKAQSFLLLSADEARYMEQRETNSSTVKDTYNRLKNVKKKGPLPEARSSQFSKIMVEIKPLEKDPSKLLIENNDMYETTAKIAVLVVEKISAGRSEFSGIINPAQLFKGEEVKILNTLNCTVSFNPKITIEPC